MQFLSLHVYGGTLVSPLGNLPDKYTQTYDLLLKYYILIIKFILLEFTIIIPNNQVLVAKNHTDKLEKYRSIHGDAGQVLQLLKYS